MSRTRSGSLSCSWASGWNSNRFPTSLTSLSRVKCGRENVSNSMERACTYIHHEGGREGGTEKRSALH